MNPFIPILLLALGATTPDEKASYEAHDLKPPPPMMLVEALPPDERGPHVVQIDQLAHFYGPVRFDHDLHVKMAAMTDGCTSCHHDLGASTVAATCISCHPAKGAGATLSRPSLKGAYHRQCLGCHRDWSHENSCGFCHVEATGAAPTHGTPDPTDILGVQHPHLESSPRYVYQTSHTPAPYVTFQHIDHIERFGLRCVDCHRGATCATCHGPDTAPRVVSKAQNCFPCHAERNCVFCHDVRARGRFDHMASTGWSLGAAHASLTCRECHWTDAMAPPPSEACRACHAGAGGFDHGKIGIALVGSHAFFDCTACHKGTDPVADLSCADCHADRSYPAYLPGQPLANQPTGTAAMPANTRTCIPARAGTPAIATTNDAPTLQSLGEPPHVR